MDRIPYIEDIHKEPGISLVKNIAIILQTDENAQSFKGQPELSALFLPALALLVAGWLIIIFLAYI